MTAAVLMAVGLYFLMPLCVLGCLAFAIIRDGRGERHVCCCACHDQPAPVVDGGPGYLTAEQRWAEQVTDRIEWPRRSPRPVEDGEVRAMRARMHAHTRT